MRFSDDPDKLTCPYCCGTKFHLPIAIWGSPYAGIWSDSYQISPLLSLIQKCPHCGKLYFYNEGNPESVEDQVNEEVKNRIKDLALESQRVMPTYEELSDAALYLDVRSRPYDERQVFYTLYLYAYNNSRYGRHGVSKESIPEFYQIRFYQYTLALINLLGDNDSLTAELWRELGDFEKSTQICKALLAKNIDVRTVKQILERAQEEDSDAFILH